MADESVSDFILRRATADEQGVIAGMIRTERLNIFGIKWENFIVAVDVNGGIVGCGQLKPHHDCVELASLVVVPAWRGRGVARALVKQLHRNAGTIVWLMCAQRLTPFYHQFGYTQITDSKQMPATFRRIHIFAKPFNWLFRHNRLAVMCCRQNHIL